MLGTPIDDARLDALVFHLHFVFDRTDFDTKGAHNIQISAMSCGSMLQDLGLFVSIMLRIAQVLSIAVIAAFSRAESANPYEYDPLPVREPLSGSDGPISNASIPPGAEGFFGLLARQNNGTGIRCMVNSANGLCSWMHVRHRIPF